MTGLNLNTSITGDRVVLNRALRVVYNWISELLSDLVGVHLLGPAFALAMLEFQSFEEDWTEGSLTHPPTVMRFSLIQDELRDLGWLDAVLGPRHLWAEVQPHSPKALVAGWPLDKRLIELVAAKIPTYFATCQEVVRNVFSARAFGPANFNADDAELRSLLECYLPPAERVRPDGTATPFPPESIINSCWLFWAEGTPGWSDHQDDRYESRALLGRLLFKALELSRIRSRMS